MRPATFPVLLPAICACLHAQDATVQHFWDFEPGDNYDDRVGTANGSVTPGSEDTDGSPETYPGGGPVLGEGHDGNSALEFGTYMPPIDDPNHNYCAIDGPALFQPGNGGFSVSYWVKLFPDEPGSGYSFARGVIDFSGDPKDGSGAAADGFQSLIARDSGNIVFRVDAPGVDYSLAIAPAAGLDDGQWHLVIATYDPSAGIELHIDGFGPDATDPTAFGETADLVFHPKPYFGAFNLKTAASATDSNSDRNGLNGALDDVAIYSGVLSRAEIEGLFDGSLQPTDIIAVPPGERPPVPVAHYWDFDTQDENNGYAPLEVYAGLPTSEPEGPTSLLPTFGEAFAGSGVSLNTSSFSTLHVAADCFDSTAGVPTALDWGHSGFAFSYWVFDHSETSTGGDGDPRGPMVLDCLAGTTTGLQVSSDTAGHFVLRLDDDQGNESISNTIAGFEELKAPAEQWVHVAVNVDRAANRVTIFFNGVSRGSYDISNLTGAIHCTQDLQLGVINGGGSADNAQTCGLDEVAFYPRTLTAGEVALLAAAAKTPVQLLDSDSPRLTADARDPATGSSTVSFSTETGFTYSLWGSPDTVNWTELVPAIPGTGAQATENHTPAGSPPAFFYQARKN